MWDLTQDRSLQLWVHSALVPQTGADVSAADPSEIKR